jgi:hypothetical protein
MTRQMLSEVPSPADQLEHVNQYSIILFCPQSLTFSLEVPAALSLTAIHPPQVNAKELSDEPNQPLSGAH